MLAITFFLPATGSLSAQWTETTTIEGEITSVQPPNSFDAGGYHIVIAANTEFLSYYRSKKSVSDLRDLIVVGTLVKVFGSKDHDSHTIAATRVTVRDEVDRRVSGFGIIDRVLASGADHVFRADGYALRVDSGTEMGFSTGLTSLGDVQTNIWVRYEGRRNESGEIVLTRAKFIKPTPHPPKRDPHRDPSLDAQATKFPPGSLIDFDGGFRTDREKHKLEDAGGLCGWYPVPQDAVLQARVREIGMRLIPQYQRDLAPDDPAKIPFRFYVVDELDIRSDLSCWEGLVLVPAQVIERLRNDDQIAAVLADGVAANVLKQGARVAFELGLLKAAQEASYAMISPAGILSTTIIELDLLRKLEDQRGRVALGLMADAGFDPWQAPEAWRLLAPGQLPKKLGKLKYPARSKYQLEILRLQYKHVGNSTDALTADDKEHPLQK